MRRWLWQRRGFALVIFDLDRFMPLNAEVGHGKGDGALKQVGLEVRGALPRKARLYRISGDEFAVLLPGMTEQQAYNWAETVRKTLEAEVRVVNRKGESRSVTVRAGVTEHLQTKRLWSKTDQNPVVMAAEAALVEAAGRGGNCVVTRPVKAVLDDMQQPAIQYHISFADGQTHETQTLDAAHVLVMQLVDAAHVLKAAGAAFKADVLPAEIWEIRANDIGPGRLIERIGASDQESA
jgi:diguanylate cyclase (GGDEF)-like protein